MESFLTGVARRIADEHPRDTDRVLVVFNNRRSLRFFQRQFAQLGRTMFLPRTTAIDDLVAELGGLKIVPNEFLLFELYRIHLELEGERAKYKTFDEFIAFGELMMGDFMEVDQYCVDAKSLFVNLHALKDIIEWDIEDPHLTEFQRDYLRFYASLYTYYSTLRERLLQEGKAYSGLAYREVAEHIETLAEGCRWEAVYFVGFNAISECERRIIGEYVRRGVGCLLTDGDPYLLRPEQEAGLFMNKHGEEFPTMLPSGRSLFGEGKRTITVVECPENVLQCKLAGRLLDEHPEWLSARERESTAVVLADEGLLLPTLSALPEGDYAVNISMGFSFCDTGMHLLATRLLALHRTADRRGYFHSALLEVLSDRLVGRLAGVSDLRRRTVRFLREGSVIRCAGSEVNAFLGSDRLAYLFTDEPLGVEGWLAMMRRLVAAIVEGEILESDKKEQQAAGSLVEILDYLDELQATYHYITDLNTLEKIYQRIAQRHQIALIGEPLSGLQVMGMLETRNLDFRRVILLSAGEGVLPAARSASSLVPYQLKRHFHMPTYQERDAVYAYNFYHLLLRAEEVYLVYSSESEAMGKGEPSRFIRQVESELAPEFGIEVRHLVVNNNEPPHEAPAVRVGEKTPQVMQQLAQLAAKGLAPTVFDDYIECPLRYYYTRVLGVRREDNLDEDLDASQLGTAIHDVLNDIYDPYDPSKHPGCNPRVEAEALRRALDELPQRMAVRFDRLFAHGRDTEGRNRFLYTVAESQLRSVLRKEIALLEEGHVIEVVALERMLGPLPIVEGVWLKGKADRIDRLDGRLRVIDYKTGSLEASEIAYSSTPNRKGELVVPGKWFQLMCYALLLAEGDPVAGGAVAYPLQAAIYPLRNLRSGVCLASWDGSADITRAMLDEFRQMLADRCSELMDSTVPFAPTARKESCRYCDVRTFCPLRP